MSSDAPSRAKSFEIGDRVLLAEPDGFVQPYRRLGIARRPATVVNAHGRGHGPYKIEFDAGRKGAAAVTMWCAATDLTLISEPSTGRLGTPNTLS